MLGGTPLMAVLGSGVDPTDRAAMRGFVRACCDDARLAVLFIQPGTKEPVDLRTAQKKRADDRAVRNAAREAGRADADRVRSPSGLHLATSDPVVALRYLDRYFDLYGEDVSVNLAVEVGRSRLVIADCDTPEQVSEFLALTGADYNVPPTVRSPGKQLPDGTWVHRDGGHFWFTVPDDVALPTSIGSCNVGETGISLLWHNRYVLIPPSVRAEGAYELVGRDYPLFDSVRRWIVDRCFLRTAAASNARAFDPDDSLSEQVDEWARSVSWDSILSPLGWVPMSKADSCGCTQWTAPGDHASPKSATAHDTGCSLGRYTDINAPLYIWTDHDIDPFTDYIATGSRALSKLRAVACVDYGGSVSDAITALGLAPSRVLDDLEGIDVPGLARETPASNLNDDLPAPGYRAYQFAGDPDPAPSDCDCSCFPCQQGLHCRKAPCWIIQQETVVDLPLQPGDVCGFCGQVTTEQDSRFDATGRLWHKHPADPDNMAHRCDGKFPGEDGGSGSPPGLYVPREAGMPTIAPFRYWADMAPPEFLVEGLIEHGGLSCLIGPAGVGKSTVALDIACHIATGRTWQGRQVLKTNVLYLPGEGLAGVVQRVRAWCEARDLAPDLPLELGSPILALAASKEAWAEMRAYLAAREIGLVVFDTFARCAVGLDENSAEHVSKAVRRFDKVRELTNCGVMVIHHTGWANQTRGRGSSALNAAVDSEILLTEGDRINVNGSMVRSIGLQVTKQKNIDYDDETTTLAMTDWRGRAPLITGPNGNVDPMMGEVLFAPPIAEPIVETAIRILEFAQRFTEQGITRAEAVAGVTPDPYTARRRDAARAWRLKVNEAIDRALRYELLVTLTGAVSGARYIPGPATPDQARMAAADEIGANDEL